MIESNAFYSYTWLNEISHLLLTPYCLRQFSIPRKIVFLFSIFQKQEASFKNWWHIKMVSNKQICRAFGLAPLLIDLKSSFFRFLLNTCITILWGMEWGWCIESNHVGSHLFLTWDWMLWNWLQKLYVDKLAYKYFWVPVDYINF